MAVAQVADVRSPRLTVKIHDRLNDAKVTSKLFSLPAMVGRSQVNSIRLHANTASRYHGAFLFWAGALRFVDFGSSNGTFVDGVRVEPDLPVSIRQNSLIEIGPYELRVDFSAIPGDEAEDVTAVSIDQEASSRSPTVVPAAATIPPKRAPIAWVPDGRAAEVMALLAELFARFRASEMMGSAGIIPGGGRTVDVILTYLTEPEALPRLDELRVSLTAIFERAEESCIRDRLS
jgi:hypothetical protein